MPVGVRLSLSQGNPDKLSKHLNESREKIVLSLSPAQICNKVIYSFCLSVSTPKPLNRNMLNAILRACLI